MSQRMCNFIVTVSVIIIAMFVFSGCATIINGGNKKDVQILSTPLGAKVTINKDTKLLTPALVPLKRNNNYDIEIEKEGYESYNAKIKKKYSFYTLINLYPLTTLQNYDSITYSIAMLSACVIPMTIDIVGGGGYELSSDHVYAPMQKKEGNLKEVNPESNFVESTQIASDLGYSFKARKPRLVTITDRSGTKFIGNFSELKGNSLLLKPPGPYWSDEYMMVNLNEITKVEVERKFNIRRCVIDCAMIGFLSGAMYSFNDYKPEYNTDYLLPILTGFGGGILGIPVGAFIGTVLGINKRVDFSKLSETEKMKEAQKLMK